jgi:hypothetical protein
MWHAQVVSALKGAQLAGYIKATSKPPPAFLTLTKKGKEKGVTDAPPNPEYEIWVAKDQQVFSFLL